jgi:leucyl aminopeptidase
MKFFPKPIEPGKVETDLLILFSYEGESIPAFSQIQINNVIKEMIQKEDYTGKTGQILSVTTKGLISSYRLIVIGLGKKEEIELSSYQKAVAKAIAFASQIKAVKIAFLLDDEISKKFKIYESIESTVVAVMLSSYRFIKYKGEEEKKQLRAIEEVFICLSAGKIGNFEQAVKYGQLKALATCYARDLVNEPAAVTTPTFLAERALTISKESEGAIKVKIMEEKEIRKLGMNAYMGVAQGSEEPPKFIILSYKPKNAIKKVVIVGKGITFDTGGLSLKPSEAMETMKLDMAGAAVVLSLFKYIREFKVNYEIVGIVPSCENMPSGKALHPGDVVKALNGKTIEVLNTDAEGRLTLADAFSYACLYEKPDYIIDLATLTGACMVALGQDVAGLWGNNQKLIEKIQNAAKTTGEKIWFMPLEQEYKELIKSHIADLKNISGGRYGGAITAALFLSVFIGTTPWVHLDIAGPAYQENKTELVPKGGSGFGVRLLLEFLQ